VKHCRGRKLRSGPEALAFPCLRLHAFISDLPPLSDLPRPPWQLAAPERRESTASAALNPLEANRFRLQASECSRCHSEVSEVGRLLQL
jgi:hypothetical protein